jgi:FkbM family methyltransferase
MRRLVHGMFGMLGLRIARMGRANRFNATSDVLQRLAAMDYQPKVIIDGGSNAGQWAAEARAAFPAAHIHLIEPQANLAAHLQAIVDRDTRMSLHSVALAAQRASDLELSGVGTTGAWIARPGQTAEPGAETVSALTLDDLFAGIITAADRTLLKLDLEGYEMEALAGGGRILDLVEVVFIEVAFYPIESPLRTTFADIHATLMKNGFMLYDVGSLASRVRDGRLRSGDVIYVRTTSPLVQDNRFA